MSQADDIQSTTLQKLVDGIIASIRFPDGSAPAAAPNGFKDRYGQTIPTTVPSASNADKGSSEGSIEIRINPGGLSGYAKVKIHSPRGISSIEGSIDVATLATKLV